MTTDRAPSKRKRVQMAREEVMRAGQLLSNIAYNIAQSHEVSPTTRSFCTGGAARWDDAVRALREAEKLP